MLQKCLQSITSGLHAVFAWDGYHIGPRIFDMLRLNYSICLYRTCSRSFNPSVTFNDCFIVELMTNLGVCVYNCFIEMQMFVDSRWINKDIHR